MKAQYDPNIPLDYIMQEEYEIDETIEYTLDTLKLGMRVHTGQLDKIKNTRILLANPIIAYIPNYGSAIYGTIVYIGDTQDNPICSKAYKRYTVNHVSPSVIQNFDDISETCYPEGWEDKNENKQ